MIELRAVVESDAEALFPLVYRTAVTDTLVWDGPESLEAYREGLRTRAGKMRDGSDMNYTMFDAEGRAVGAVGMLVDGYNRSATLGLWIGQPYHGLGYGSHAVRRMVQIGLGELKLERMESRIYVGNVASRRVFEKNGFLLEGILRRVAFKRGMFLDEWVMGVVREDCAWLVEG